MSNDLVVDTASDWDEFYAQPSTEVQRQIGHTVCGCDYDGSSWMGAAEAMEQAALLRLSADSHLLDIGSGSGWPALYQAKRTGCRITLTDISREGLKAADKKACADGLGDRCKAVLAGAERLPFASSCFDAIGHADVLCCLEDKLDSLSECRRVIRGTGTMSFSVIHMRKGAGASEIEEAAAAGPSLIDAPADYPTMLEQTGWRMEAFSDITSGFAQILDRLHTEYERHATAIRTQRSEEHYTELLEKCKAKRRVVVGGSVERSLFTVTPQD